MLKFWDHGPLFCSDLLDLPRRPYKLTVVRSFVRPFVTSFSRDRLINSFWFLAQRCKMTMPKMWRSPIFEKKNHSRPKMPEICRKTGYLAFSRDFINNFFWFFAQICLLRMPKTWPSLIFEKFFSGRKCRKYARNRRFWSDFFLIFLCFLFTQHYYWFNMGIVGHCQ